MGVREGQYRYLQDLLQLEAATHQRSHVSWPRGPTPLSAPAFARHLATHPDQNFAAYIMRGISLGFRVGYSGDAMQLRSHGRNHPSSLANPAVVSDNISSEILAGRLVGPVPVSFLSQVHTSPIGLVPKGHTVGRWRMIVDLSSPTRHSVNDGICEDVCSLQYASLDDALRLICRLGPGTQLVKMDLKDAYRAVPIHPGDHHLLGISWNGGVYVDRSLPFGLRSAPKLYTALADAMAWSLFTRGIPFLLHYLDDFLFITPPNANTVPSAREIAAAVFADLGVPVASHKTEGPSARVKFLGFLVDTESFQLSLPDEKLIRLQELMASWRGKRSCTRRELESLLGHLSHAATAIRPGRLFLRRLFSLLQKVDQPHFFTRLNSTIRADLSWWSFFLREWNGVSLFPPGPPSVHLFSDASGSYGCGAVDPNRAYFNLQWPQQWSTVDISVKELLPLVLAAVMWGPTWKGRHVLFHVDNMAVVSVVQNLNARDPLLCHFLRCLYLYAAFFQFTFSATHIPGTNNTAADALSRGNFELFHSLVPQVLHQPIPHILNSLFLLQTPDWNCSAWMGLFKSSLRLALPPPQLQPTTPVSVAI